MRFRANSGGYVIWLKMPLNSRRSWQLVLVDEEPGPDEVQPSAQKL